MSTVSNSQFANPWKDLWNGDLTITPKFIAENFVAHAAPLTGSGPGEIHGRDALNAWVTGIHSVLPDLAFTIEVGPITDKDYLVVRWRARHIWWRLPGRLNEYGRLQGHVHGHRYLAHRQRQDRRVLGQRRQSAVCPAAWLERSPGRHLITT
jgi:hypothetical protein